LDLERLVSLIGLTGSKFLIARFRPIQIGQHKAAGSRSDSHVWTLRSQLMKTLLSRFVKDQSGATAIEYGLIAAGISVAIIAVVQGLGTSLKNTFSSVSTALTQ
jgi:pilus assembly protein Flp/PilA